MDPQTSNDRTFRIELPVFEGPLDLLLHLIRKHELDIIDLPISFVTERYLEYLELMQKFDLDIASEYLVMAATLAHIKSRMMLPAPPAETDDELGEEEELDPRAELIRRLLEYQKYKEAAERLGARSIAGRDVFNRGTSTEQLEAMDEPAPLREVGVFALVDAFERILQKVKGRLVFEIDAERITINERISQITEVLRVRRMCMFEELFEMSSSRYELVVTFLAVLEMAKLRIAKIYQAEPSSPIHVSFALLDVGEPTVPPSSESVSRELIETAADLGVEAVEEVITEVDAEASVEPTSGGEINTTEDPIAELSDRAPIDAIEELIGDPVIDANGENNLDTEQSCADRVSQETIEVETNAGTAAVEQVTSSATLVEEPEHTT
jgi:segregation and condensation protein A